MPIPLKSFELPPPNPGLLLLLNLPPDASMDEVKEAWEANVRSKAATYFNTPPATHVTEQAQQLMALRGCEWPVAWAAQKARLPALFRAMAGQKPAGTPWLGSDLAEKLSPKK
ncbi:MAG: hypothetical protein ABMA01_22600 [Chthoniobacteraceae bacterium]